MKKFTIEPQGKFNSKRNYEVIERIKKNGEKVQCTYKKKIEMNKH